MYPGHFDSPKKSSNIVNSLLLTYAISVKMWDNMASWCHQQRSDWSEIFEWLTCRNFELPLPWILNLVNVFPYFLIISPLKSTWSFIWTNLNPLYQRMLHAKFGWKWLYGSGEDYFKNFVNVFSLFWLLSPLGNKCGSSFEQIWIPFTEGVLCARFGWNRPIGSG